MSIHKMFDRLFDSGGSDIKIEETFIHGTATVCGREAVIIGTCNQTLINSELALKIAGAILNAVRDDSTVGCPPRPIVFLVDTRGQELSRHDELIGLNGYFAHVARCVDLAKRYRHRVVTLIHGEAVSGGFLAFGMMADRVCSLPDAHVRVMDMHAMARVTRIAYEKLSELAGESPVFAPGAENFWRMGAVHELWGAGDDWRACLAAALNAYPEADDSRAALGLERGGRQLAAPVAGIVTSA